MSKDEGRRAKAYLRRCAGLVAGLALALSACATPATPLPPRTATIEWHGIKISYVLPASEPDGQNDNTKHLKK